MKNNGLTVAGVPHQGTARFKLEMPHVGSSPSYAVQHNKFTAAVSVLYDMNTGKGLVLMVDGDHGASVTNSAGKLIPFIHRLHLGCRGIQWRNVRWLYRDSEGNWDEIVVATWDGSNEANIGFRTLGDRTIEAALATASKCGFPLDAHERAHLQRAIKHAGV